MRLEDIDICMSDLRTLVSRLEIRWSVPTRYGSHIEFPDYDSEYLYDSLLSTINLLKEYDKNNLY